MFNSLYFIFIYSIYSIDYLINDISGYKYTNSLCFINSSNNSYILYIFTNYIIYFYNSKVYTISFLISYILSVIISIFASFNSISSLINYLSIVFTPFIVLSLIIEGLK